MTVSDLSSSAANPAERPSVNLLELGLLPPLPAAFLGGRELDLLEPLRLIGPRGSLPKVFFDGIPPAPEREELAQGLAVANSAYGHPRAEQLAAKLADPATRVVVAGQQPGLLGGPLYTLSKAVAAVLWSRQIEAAGHPALAVFWVATEDHDFREVSRIFVPAGESVLTLGLGEDPAPLLPVGMRTLGAPVTDVLSELKATFPGDRFAAWVDRVGSYYRPEARFGEAFSRLMITILGEHCPLLLDAMLPAVKRAEQTWLHRVVARREEVAEAYGTRDREIEKRGHALQVQPQPSASPLFLLHRNARRRIEWLGDRRFGLRGEGGFEEDVSELERVIEENPAAVSPGVLARPAIQDAILGTTLQVMGPGEVSYLPQVAPLYRCLGIDAPWVALRPQALVLTANQLDKLDALPFDLADLVSPEFDLDGLLASGEGRSQVEPVSAEFERLLGELRVSALALDKTLERPWEKTRGQIHKALEVFTTKINQAAARRDELGRRRARAMRDACRPLGTLQERILTTSYFPGKFGAAFTETLLEQLGLDPRVLHVVSP